MLMDKRHGAMYLSVKGYQWELREVGRHGFCCYAVAKRQSQKLVCRLVNGGVRVRISKMLCLF